MTEITIPEIDVSRVLRAISYAVAAVAAVLGTVGAPTTWQGWVGFVLMALVAGWGKYSTSTRLVHPNREVWEGEEPTQP